MSLYNDHINNEHHKLQMKIESKDKENLFCFEDSIIYVIFINILQYIERRERQKGLVYLFHSKKNKR
jgi:hypothetical protein